MSKDDNTSLQDDELTLLKSMFTQDELVFDEACTRPLDFVQPHMESSAAGTRERNSSGASKNHSFTLKLNAAPNLAINLDVTFPSSYPSDSRPLIYARCNQLDQKAFNHALQQFFEKEAEPNQPVMMDLVAWINEFAEKYRLNGIDKSAEASPECCQPTKEEECATPTYARLWIFSHHLYSTTKRKNIMKLTKQLKLRGFMAHGKPAFIVVEGLECHCDDFWEEVHSWNWQKIQIKQKEVSETEEDFKRLPEKFQELSLPVTSAKNQCGGDLKNYLAALGFEHMYFEVLSIDQSA
ncbi:RWD domain-containing protein [Ditylenchus destructor]|uniref:RWD domain-containing protein n=1 Tax=Ditylenchus destructor TaxID=166010 RepID=A0AAD4N3T5_9BILA|nr:RWD domain-containing protein [Ditylenchus destructor]